jgi:hypothetical protein
MSSASAVHVQPRALLLLTCAGSKYGPGAEDNQHLR